MLALTLLSAFALSDWLLSTAHASTSPLATQLEGRWRSEHPETLPAKDGAKNYLVREFSFNDARWRLDFTLYEDAELQLPLLSGRNEGHYILEPSSGESMPAEFFFERRSLTARVESIAAALSAAGCGDERWVVGHAQSVIERGCPAFRVFAQAECDREYDRVKLVRERLFLGARPADGFMCESERRPGEVSATPLVRWPQLHPR